MKLCKKIKSFNSIASGLALACLLLSVISFLTACSSSVTRKTADWDYEKNAISIDLKADQSLNLYDGYSHALNVAIIQVSSPTKITQLLQTANGLVTVMEHDKHFQGETAYKRVSLQPGQKKSLTLDRQKDTQYVYLIFGYASEIVTKGDYLIPIPLDDKPQKLHVDVVLGPAYVSSIHYNK